MVLENEICQGSFIPNGISLDQTLLSNVEKKKDKNKNKVAIPMFCFVFVDKT